MLGTADPSAQLIQIGETKLIRAINDDRVCIWNIQAAFDDRGANEHVSFARDKSCHHRLELVGVHLAVAYLDPGLRTKMHNSIAYSLDARDAVMYKEHLALASQFASNRATTDSFIVPA